jgi:hypothetical protein
MYKNNPKSQMRGTRYFRIELFILSSLHSFMFLGSNGPNKLAHPKNEEIGGVM